MDRWKMLSAILFLTGGLSACGTGGEEGSEAAVEVPEGASASDEVLSAQHSFGINLFQKVWEKEENALVSPVSAYMALAMTVNGAGDSTRSEMAETLGIDENELEQLNETMQIMVAEMTGSDDSTFLLANSIWSDENLEADESFLEIMETHYGASTHAVNFEDPAVEDMMNEWVAEETSDMIDDLVDDLDPDTVMMLINALYFKGEWTLPFDEDSTSQQPFTTATGEEVIVEMMTTTESYDYGSFDDYEAVKLPYGEDELFSMVAVLPDEGADLENILDAWGEGEGDWLEELQDSNLQVNLPAFELEGDYELNGALKEMGMTAPFDPERADFSRLFTDIEQDLYISGVNQMTKMEVNEEGTEAAAATSVGIETVSMPPTLTFDRPFFIMLIENETKTPLFIGYIENPAEE